MPNESQNRRAILEARHHDPFSYLGLHHSKSEYVLRVFQPYATAVSVHDGAAWLPLERSDAAGLFVWRGKQALPVPCRLRLDYSGHMLEVHDAYTFGNSITDHDLYGMNSMMRLVVTDGTGSRAAFPDFDIAGKTGTSQDYRDAWFVGYTSDLIAGVWVGNDDNSPTKKVTAVGNDSSPVRCSTSSEKG